MNIKQAAASLGVVSLFGMQAFGSWSIPVKIVEVTDTLGVAGFTAGPGGTAFALWTEHIFGDPARILSRTTSAGPWGWGATTEIPDRPIIDFESTSAAMNKDGMAIVSWWQTPDLQNGDIMARKFIPGAGWGPIQTVARNSASPTLAIAPDGRAHILGVDAHGLFATTQGPGEETWSPPVYLYENRVPTGNVALIAGLNFAYAALPLRQDNDSARSVVELAAYDASAWHPGTLISDKDATQPQLTVNGAEVALTWREFGGNGDVGRVRRLTGLTETFGLPNAFCKLALGPDGTAVALCPARGDPVAGCIEPTRGGPVQAYYSYLESYRRGRSGEWSAAETISSRERRIQFDLRLLTSSQGGAYALWPSDVPCQAGTSGLFGNAWSPKTSAWGAAQAFYTDRAPATESQRFFSAVLGAAVDSAGALHVLVFHRDFDAQRTPLEITSLSVVDANTAKGN